MTLSLRQMWSLRSSVETTVAGAYLCAKRENQPAPAIFDHLGRPPGS